MSRLPFRVGLTLGLAVALLGIYLGVLRIPNGLSFALVLLAAAIALCSAERPYTGTLRVTRTGQALIVYALGRSCLEFYNAGVLDHPFNFNVPAQAIMLTVAYGTARMVIGSPADAYAFLRGFAIPVYGVVAFAVLQVFKVGPVIDLLLTYTRSEGFHRRFELGYEIRATSTIGHHTELAAYFLGAIAVGLTMMFLARHLNISPRGSVILIGASVLGIMTTLTFALMGAAVLLVGVAVLRLGASVRLVLVAGLGILASGAIGWVLRGDDISRRLAETAIQKSDRFSWLPSTVAFRTEVWINETIPAIAQRPLTGWGFDVYDAGVKGWPQRPLGLDWISPESEYFRTLISFGWLGLLLQAFLFFELWRACRRLDTTTVDTALPTRWLIYVALVVSTIHSHFASPPLPFVLFSLIGVLEGLRLSHERAIPLTDSARRSHRLPLERRGAYNAPTHRSPLDP